VVRATPHALGRAPTASATASTPCERGALALGAGGEVRELLTRMRDVQRRMLPAA